jgi:hypothetical protein
MMKNEVRCNTAGGRRQRVSERLGLGGGASGAWQFYTVVRRFGLGSGHSSVGLATGVDHALVGRLGCVMLGRAPTGHMGRPTALNGPPILGHIVLGPIGLS